MKPEIKVYWNCDETYIVWKIAARIGGCRGFALYRRRNGKVEIVDTWVGFAGDSAPPGTHKPSTEWPIQKFMWSDYLAKAGDKVAYQVVPVIASKNKLVVANDLASDWTEEITIEAGEKGISAYFNRGIVATQWLARSLGGGTATASAKQQKLSEIMQQVGNKTRNFLAGELRGAILEFLNNVGKGKIYAALFELDDPELEAGLIKLGKQAEIILANGSTKKKGEDENKDARNKLKNKVNLYNRMVPTGRLAHNKFLVICDEDDNPVQAFTGSTNWTKTGLCTQANNGLLINDPTVAAIYKSQWDLLKISGDGFPPDLIETNGEAKNFKVADATGTVWFTPLQEEKDLDFATDLINKAQEGILFLMFNPGPRGTLLNAIIERNSQASANYNPELYIHGVLNQDPSTKKNPIVGLFHRGQYTPANFNVVLPTALDQDERLKYWIEEIKKYKNAWAMVHSKVIVLDPFGKHPVVMTGSHNMGPKASSKNDDNLVIIENDWELASAYAVNIMSIYNQYRWRYYLMQSNKSDQWTGLQDNDKWQDGYFQDAKLRELNFWLGKS